MEAAEAEPPFLSIVLFDDLFAAPGIQGKEMDLRGLEINPLGMERDLRRTEIDSREMGTDPRGMEMNPQLWNDFPEELLEAVLLRLPASSQARFPAVSKPWLQLLTSQRFRKRTAELAFTYDQHICGVIYSRDVHWEWAPPDRYKVHQVNLGFLPSHIQVGEGCPHLHFQEGLMVFGLPNETLFVVNIANKTWRELPESRHDCSPSSLFCVSESDKEAPGFAVYAHFFVDSDLDEVDSTVENYWNVYESSSNAWKPMMIKEDRSRPLSRREVFVTEETIHTSGGTDIVHSDVYGRRSGKLVQSLPPWQEGTIPHIQYMRRFEQVFPLNFSTSEENLCEV